MSRGAIVVQLCETLDPVGHLSDWIKSDEKMKKAFLIGCMLQCMGTLLFLLFLYTPVISQTQTHLYVALSMILLGGVPSIVSLFVKAFDYSGDSQTDRVAEAEAQQVVVMDRPPQYQNWSTSTSTQSPPPYEAVYHVKGNVIDLDSRSSKTGTPEPFPCSVHRQAQCPGTPEQATPTSLGAHTAGSGAAKSHQ